MVEARFGWRAWTGAHVTRRPRVGAPRRVVAVVALAGLATAGGVVMGAARPAAASGAGRVLVEREVPVTAMNRSVGWANNSPELAADPDDEEVLALANRVDAPDFSCRLHVSGDAGRSWVPVDPVDALPVGADKCYAPNVVFGPDGTLYFLFAGLAGAGNEPMGVFLTTSQDRGQSFSEPTQVLGELKFGADMAVDPAVGSRGRLHFAWVEATSDPGLGSFGPPPNPVMAAYSDDGGQTLSEPVQVSGELQRVVGPAVTVGPEGGVHVAFYDLGEDARDYQGLEGPTWEGPWELVVTSSENRGDSFEPGEAVAQVTPHERIMVIFTTPPPAVAAGPDGEVCVGWADARHGDADVLVRCTTPDGRSWREVAQVNDDPRGNGVVQKLPALAVAPNGRVDAVFYDQRRISEQTVYQDVFYAASTDGGASFGANTRVSDQPSFIQIGPRYPALASAAGQVDFGGRLALHVLTDRVIAAWADTRNSRPPSTAQDVIAATLTGLPGGAVGLPLPWATGGLAVAVAGAVALGGLIRRRRRTAITEAGVAGPSDSEPQPVDAPESVP